MLLTDLYIKELEAFLGAIKDKGEEAYLYMTYQELIAEREAVLEALREYEKGFSTESGEIDFEMPYPDPKTMYHINLKRLELFSELIYHKHFSFVIYENMQRFGEGLPGGFESERDKIIGMIKKNPKSSYIDILNQDIQLKVALDMLIEDENICRTGKNLNTYWKVNMP